MKGNIKMQGVVVVGGSMINGPLVTYFSGCLSPISLIFSWKSNVKVLDANGSAFWAPVDHIAS